MSISHTQNILSFADDFQDGAVGKNMHEMTLELLDPRYGAYVYRR